MPTELSLQVELSLRLLGAALFGALVGSERERHGHPAGMRTHLLVALGSGLFTVLSAYGFGGFPIGDGATVDPTRIAAQVVSGIGFLGAGAIIKYGASIRGLTTAASLWATAAVGMAVGAGSWVLAATATAIILVSLAPLSWLSHRLRGGKRRTRVGLHLADLDALGSVTRSLGAQHVEIVDFDSRRSGGEGLDVGLSLLVPARIPPSDIVGELGRLERVEVISSEAEDD